LIQVKVSSIRTGSLSLNFETEERAVRIIEKPWHEHQGWHIRRAIHVEAPLTRWLSALVVATFVIVGASAYAAEKPVQIYAVKDSLESVKDEVINAIVKRGLVVDYIAHVGTMLARTAKDVGASKTIYAEAQSLQFCSATLSRRMMEADTANVAFCPHVIFVYALPGSPGTTQVGYRPLLRIGSRQSKAAIDAVNALLDGIVREAIGKK
jgi:hypothetical protein